MNTRRILRHGLVLSVTFALMLAGLSVLGQQHDGGFATSASAAAGDHLQISLNTPTPAWSTSVGAVWTLNNAAPGSSVSGTVKLKRIGASSPQTSLSLSSLMPSPSSPSLGDVVRISALSLGATNLLPLWPAACQANLTLSALNSTCPSPSLPVPPQDPGTTFSMTLSIASTVGNTYQGKTTGPVTFVFTLTDTTPDTPGRFVVRNNMPNPFSPGSFTMTVVQDSTNTVLVSGNGTDKSANNVPINQSLTTTVTGSLTSKGSTMHFVNVTCTSTARPNFTLAGTAIANGAKFQTSLAFPNETLTCTFNWALNP